MKQLMECGCVAQGISAGKPVCVIHLGLVKGADQPVMPPDLSERTARCSYGKHSVVASSLDLAFFEYLPDEEQDKYYCGCWGWD